MFINLRFRWEGTRLWRVSDLISLVGGDGRAIGFCPNEKGIRHPGHSAGWDGNLLGFHCDCGLDDIDFGSYLNFEFSLNNNLAVCVPSITLSVSLCNSLLSYLIVKTINLCEDDQLCFNVKWNGTERNERSIWQQKWNWPNLEQSVVRSIRYDSERPARRISQITTQWKGELDNPHYFIPALFDNRQLSK